MSNKTSDENVANIERLNNFANMTFLYGNRVNLNVSGLKEIQNDIKNILSDYTRQKQINEEHQKINGELREKVKELEKNIEKISESSSNNEELIKKINSGETFTVKQLGFIKKNFIPKQKVKDKIEEFMFLGLRKRAGISKKEFRECFHKNIMDVYGEVISKYEKIDLLEWIKNGEMLRLTDAGIDVSDYIFCDFML